MRARAPASTVDGYDNPLAPAAQLGRCHAGQGIKGKVDYNFCSVVSGRAPSVGMHVCHGNTSPTWSTA